MTLFDRFRPRPARDTEPPEEPASAEPDAAATPGGDEPATDEPTAGRDVPGGPEPTSDAPGTGRPSAEDAAADREPSQPPERLPPTTPSTRSPGPATTSRGRLLTRRFAPRESEGRVHTELPSASRHQLDDFQRRIRQRRFVLDDIGLADRLGLRRSVTALFAGPADTGKMLAAEHVARSIEAHVVEVSLPRLLSPQDPLFEELADILENAAEDGDIVYIDRAMRLLRSYGEEADAQTAWATESAWILLGGFDGALILAADQRPGIDPVESERVDVIVDFPTSDLDNAVKILVGAFPPEVQPPPTSEVREVLERLRLPSRSTANIVTGVAFRAADRDRNQPLVITQRDLVTAIAREYQKRGRVISEGEFGSPFYKWVEEDVL